MLLFLLLLANVNCKFEANTFSVKIGKYIGKIKKDKKKIIVGAA